MPRNHKTPHVRFEYLALVVMEGYALVRHDLVGSCKERKISVPECNHFKVLCDFAILLVEEIHYHDGLCD